MVIISEFTRQNRKCVLHDLRRIVHRVQEPPRLSDNEYARSNENQSGSTFLMESPYFGVYPSRPNWYPSYQSYQMPYVPCYSTSANPMDCPMGCFAPPTSMEQQNWYRNYSTQSGVAPSTCDGSGDTSAGMQHTNYATPCTPEVEEPPSVHHLSTESHTGNSIVICKNAATSTKELKGLVPTHTVKKLKSKRKTRERRRHKIRRKHIRCNRTRCACEQLEELMNPPCKIPALSWTQGSDVTPTPHFYQADVTHTFKSGSKVWRPSGIYHPTPAPPIPRLYETCSYRMPNKAMYCPSTTYSYEGSVRCLF